MRLWFIRHAEPEARYVGSFIGRTEAALSPLGQHQAEALKEYLREAPVDAVLASPRRRAKGTVAPLAAAHGIPIRTVDAFSEMDFGRWEGLHWDEILRLDREYALRWQEDPSALPPLDGESCQDFQARIEAGVEALLEEFRDRHVVLGAHAGTCRAILAHLLRIDYLEAFVFAQDYGALNAAEWPEGMRGQVALVNFVPGPKSTGAGE